MPMPGKGILQLVKALDYEVFQDMSCVITATVRYRKSMHSRGQLSVFFTRGCNNILMLHCSNAHEAPWGEVSDNRSLGMDSSIKNRHWTDKFVT
jgi:hypothetical protein